MPSSNDKPPGRPDVGRTEPAATPPTQSPQQCKEIYFRGLGEVFSIGMDMLAADRGIKGPCATEVHSWLAQPSVANSILSDPKARQTQYYLAGHSLGGQAALELAKTLQKNGVKVQALATIDRAFAFATSAKDINAGKVCEDSNWLLHPINSITNSNMVAQCFDKARTAPPARPPANERPPAAEAPIAPREAVRDRRHPQTLQHRAELPQKPAGRPLSHATSRTEARTTPPAREPVHPALNTLDRKVTITKAHKLGKLAHPEQFAVVGEMRKLRGGIVEMTVLDHNHGNKPVTIQVRDVARTIQDASRKGQHVRKVHPDRPRISP
jgi:pimeloyl-ACP methyl ester carboxylesterase